MDRVLGAASIPGRVRKVSSVTELRLSKDTEAGACDSTDTRPNRTIESAEGIVAPSDTRGEICVDPNLIDINRGDLRYGRQPPEPLFREFKPRARNIILCVVRAGSHPDGVSQRIMFDTTAEVLVAAAAHGTFNLHRIVHDIKPFNQAV